MLTLADIVRASVSRAEKWHPKGIQEWSPLEWAGAMAGEAGEACNAAKKLKRIEGGLPNINTEQGREILDSALAARKKVAHEVADTILYAVLLMVIVGGDLEKEVRDVFNQKSEEYGFPERL